MRIIAFVLLVFLVSCATPQSHPNAYYGETYAPGAANISEQGSFISVAHVVSQADFPTARMAAFARLKEKAEADGYQYFEIIDESRKKFLGTHFVAKGQLYREENYGANAYPIGAITLLLKGLPLGDPLRPRIVEPAYLDAKGSGGTLGRRPAGGDPLVILAPVDITGSIASSSGDYINEPAELDKIDFGEGVVMDVAPIDSLEGIPTGVLLRKKN